MSTPYLCRGCGQKFRRLTEYESHPCSRWKGYPWDDDSDDLTPREINFALLLVIVICLLGVVVTLEVTAIVDAKREDEALIQLFEHRKQQDKALAQCIDAAASAGLDFVQLCPELVYR